MKYKKLGQTDLDVSLICLGTMTWGVQNTESEGHEQMDYALDQGVNFWDTAEMYSVPPAAETQGSTERIIGTWFQKTGRRQDVILATKIAGLSKMIWTREDDMHHGYYHTISAQRVKVGVKDGKVTAWKHKASYPSIGQTFNPAANGPSGFEMDLGLKDIPFEIDNLQISHTLVKVKIRTENLSLAEQINEALRSIDGSHIQWRATPDLNRRGEQIEATFTGVWNTGSSS